MSADNIPNQTQRAQHRGGIGLVLTSDVEGAAVADAGEQHAGAYRQRRGAPSGQQLYRDVALIVIDRDEAVDVLATEDDIGARPGPRRRCRPCAIAGPQAP